MPPYIINMWYSLALTRRQIFRFSIDETLDHFKILYLKSVPVFSYSSNAGELFVGSGF